MPRRFWCLTAQLQLAYFVIKLNLHGTNERGHQSHSNLTAF